MIQIKVPAVGESINEVTLLKWLKNDGDFVNRDEVIAELESEKATFEVNAEQSGTIQIIAKEGDTLNIGAVLANIDEKGRKFASATQGTKGPTLSKPKNITIEEPEETKPVTQENRAPQTSTVPANETPNVKTEKPAESPSLKETPAAKVAQPSNDKPLAEAAQTPSKETSGKGIIEIKVPTVGESINEVTLLKWLKKDREHVDRDQVIAELESEKATFELNADESGELKIVAQEGDVLKIGDVVATINTNVGATAAASKQEQPESVNRESPIVNKEPEPGNLQPAAGDQQPKATPVASAMIADKKVDPSQIKPSGTGGKILKHDVLEALSHPAKQAFNGQELFSRNERRERMSNLRKTISRRLVESKNTTAMLTTFNEVDMGRIMEIRKQHKEAFNKVHGVNLGFMSFFAKACAIALSEWPAVNAYIDGDEIIYHDYADISIAVSTPRGLTVPVMRNVESASMADIERKVIELAGKARDSKLTTEDLQGGTFTITNGGVFGSLMSTPIINLPQSAILGMHKIQERPVALNGQVVIRPMMYVALSYDHRIVDGRESVSFLVRVKELLENPELLLFSKDPVKALLEI